MIIEFDPAKSRKNAEERGMSFEIAEDFEFDTAIVRRDTRKDYPEPRFQGHRPHRRDDLLPGVHAEAGRLPGDLTEEGQAQGERRMARKPDPEMTDEDAPELTDAELAEMRPAVEVLPADFYAVVTKRPRGRPKADRTKVPVTLRLDRDVVEAFRAKGPGWQTRMNAALREAAAGSSRGRGRGRASS
jgi:uncharacterized protein (DUF4415 family)/uncharacterized DUF497 family protein